MTGRVAEEPSGAQIYCDASTSEPALQAAWEESGVYRFVSRPGQPVYAIDTPPPTVSGALHVGHACSYNHADFIARVRRMRGAVYYPMGFDELSIHGCM